MPPFAQRLETLLSAPDRLLWAVRVRWLTIVGFLLLAVVAHAFGLFTTVGPVFLVAVLGGALNAVNGWCVRQRRYVLLVSAVAIPFDHVFTTYLVVNSGGIQSPFLMVYVVQVLATAMLVDALVAAASAGLAIVLWWAAVSLQAAGYIQGAPLFATGVPVSLALHEGTWAAFLFYCLALLVYLGGYISERLRTSERDLEEKNRRLLEALSSVEGAHAELQAAYARLQQTEAHLVHSEKMRGLGQLVAGVAHELNNPISFVAGNIEQLRAYVQRLTAMLNAYAAAPLPAAERARLDALRHELRIDALVADLPALLDDCEEGTRRTTRIVGQLRSFSRSNERETWQHTDLHRGIDSTLALLAHRFADRITVHRQFGALPEVECLPGQINQVFMNLLANAADAIGGRPGNIWIATGVQDCSVTITIGDDGPGMPPEVCARVFEPFFTTKPVGKGTGLGLSVSYGIIARHHGTLAVDSTPGDGATFTITLPVRQPGGGEE
ncbi:MAG TPA: ATP-binding protein [Candidatus Margulisiibacteriota bacterium]|nr:ATP-binding protein [Candidatus Margulisiibacteriota bacterium]